MMAAVLALFLLAAPALTQGPPRAYFPWWEGPLTQSLDLTQEQRDKIRSILKDHRNTMIDRRAALEKAEAEIEDLFSEPNVPEARFQAAVDNLVRTRGDMTRSFTMMSLQLRQILSAEQWRSLQEKRSQFERSRPRTGRRPVHPSPGEPPQRPPDRPGGPEGPAPRPDLE